MKTMILISSGAMMVQLLGSNVIVNGDFQSPVQANGTFAGYPSIPGWSPRGTVTSVFVVGENPPIASWPLVGQGGAGQFSDIGNAPGTGIRQTITLPTGLPFAELSWYDATSTLNGRTSTYLVRLLDAGNAVVLGGSYGTNASSWTGRVLTLAGPVAAGNYTLEYEPTSGTGQNDTLIDSVQLIPEASVALLLGAAALGGAFTRRRVG